MARSRVCRICGRAAALRRVWVDACVDRLLTSYHVQVCWSCWQLFDAMLDMARRAERAPAAHQLELQAVAR